MVKPHPLLIAAPLVLLALPRTAALRAAFGALVSAGLVVLVSLALDPHWPADFAVSMGRIGGAPIRRSTIFGLFGPDASVLAWTVVALGVAGAIWWTVRARPNLERVIAVAIPPSLLFALYGWSYDDLLLLVPAVVIVAMVGAAPPLRRVAIHIALAASLVPLAWALYVVAFRRGDEAFTALVPIAVLCVFVVASRDAPARW